MDKPQTISFRRRNLPHWRVRGRPYFVTIRLKNSIPPAILEEMSLQYEKLAIKQQGDGDVFQVFEKQFMKMETILDSAEDNLFLNNKDVSKMVIESIEFMEEKSGWRIPASVVMPNHVHLFMFEETITISLDKCLSGFKAHTAREANKILGREGAFWCPEYFDHWCRTPQKEESIKDYINNNPVRAGFVKKPEDWPWLRIKDIIK